jgi:hypothetical protein
MKSKRPRSGVGIGQVRFFRLLGEPSAYLFGSLRAAPCRPTRHWCRIFAGMRPKFTFAHIRKRESGAMQKLTTSIIAFAHSLHDENFSNDHSNWPQTKITTCIISIGRPGHRFWVDVCSLIAEIALSCGLSRGKSAKTNAWFRTGAKR